MQEGHILIQVTLDDVAMVRVPFIFFKCNLLTVDMKEYIVVLINFLIFAPKDIFEIRLTKVNLNISLQNLNFESRG
jgi:hypothetical protein